MTSNIEKQPSTNPVGAGDRPESVDKQPSVGDDRSGDIVDGTFTPEEEKQVLRKIDRVILPMMCFVFFMQYLDKQSLSYASVSLSCACLGRMTIDCNIG